MNIDLGILLGSGWGKSLKYDKLVSRTSYADIPELGAATVVGHAGELLVFETGGKTVAAFCGRRHFYEGEGWGPVIAPIEILRKWNCRQVLLTNAAGGINPDYKPGELVIVSDHINIHAQNPLIGPHRKEWGERFPDMTEVYSKRLRQVLRSQIANEGVYAFCSGPIYETPAEIRAYKAMGADLVGMSTVPEATLAHACGMEVAAISLVSNMAAGISGKPLSHAEVMAAAEAAIPKMQGVIDAFIHES